jgi:hypothetical protein
VEFKRISYHNINIRHTANGGCIVKVGCGEFSFSKPEDMLEALTQYFDDPKKMEKEYNYVNGPQVEESPNMPNDCPEQERPGINLYKKADVAQR